MDFPFQTTLPVRMFHEIDTSAESAQTATICEAVRTVAIIIQFVSKVRCTDIFLQFNFDVFIA